MTEKKTYPIFVDYDKSVEELVMLGEYVDYWMNYKINNEYFTTERSGRAEMEIELIHFDRVISSKDAIKEMDEMGYRPAELHDLLTFGIAYPDAQLKFPIVGLHPTWQNIYQTQCVVDLDKDDSGRRRLSLVYFNSDWADHCRFAAVRKPA